MAWPQGGVAAAGGSCGLDRGDAPKLYPRGPPAAAFGGRVLESAGTPSEEEQPQADDEQRRRDDQERRTPRGVVADRLQGGGRVQSCFERRVAVVPGEDLAAAGRLGRGGRAERVQVARSGGWSRGG